MPCAFAVKDANCGLWIASVSESQLFTSSFAAGLRGPTWVSASPFPFPRFVQLIQKLLTPVVLEL